MSRKKRFVTLGVLAVLLAACARTQPIMPAAPIVRPAATAKVLLMPPDIELSELTIGGLLEVKADWTAAARKHVASALKHILAEHDAEIVPYRAPPEGSEAAHLFTQLIKLHGTVGAAIIAYRLAGPDRLPTKKDVFDWTLGREAVALRRASGADYALFVFLRDSYASVSRTAFIVAGVLLGVGVPGGAQVGFASLVDLSNGNIVWFNLLRSGTGDLRQPEPALAAVRHLLEGFPL